MGVSKDHESVVQLGNMHHWMLSALLTPGVGNTCAWQQNEVASTLMAAERYVSLDRSAYSRLAGVGRSGVTSSPRESSSAATFASTSGCCEMRNLAHPDRTSSVLLEQLKTGVMKRGSSSQGIADGMTGSVHPCMRTHLLSAIGTAAGGGTRLKGGKSSHEMQQGAHQR